VDLARIVSHARSLADFDVLNVQRSADNFPRLDDNDDADQFAQLAALLPGYTAIPATAWTSRGRTGGAGASAT